MVLLGLTLSRILTVFNKYQPGMFVSPFKASHSGSNLASNIDAI